MNRSVPIQKAKAGDPSRSAPANDQRKKDTTPTAFDVAVFCILLAIIAALVGGAQ